MVEKKAGAIALHKLMLDVGAKLDSSLLLAMETFNEEEYVQYRRIVAGLMADIMLEVLNPIYKKYPDLKPDELE